MVKEIYNTVDNLYLHMCNEQIIHEKVKIELLDDYEHTIGEITTCLSSTDGSINIKKDQGVRRTCSLTIYDVNKKLLPDNEYSPFFINKRFKIYVGLYGSYTYERERRMYWFSQGVFIPTEANYNFENNSLTLSGVDKFGFFTDSLKQATLQNTYRISAGSKLGDVVSSITTMSMGNGTPIDSQTPIIDTCLYNQELPCDIEKTANESFGDILIELANVFNADIFYNADGRLVFTKQLIDDYDRLAPVYNFNNNYISNFSPNYNYSNVINQITVTGSNNDGEAFSYTAQNTNPQSSLRISNIGIKSGNIEESAMGYSEKRCKDYAEYLLKKETVLKMSGTISCTPLPHLDVDRIVKDESADKKYLIEEIEIPLTPDNYNLSVCNIQELPMMLENCLLFSNNYSWVLASGVIIYEYDLNTNTSVSGKVIGKINNDGNATDVTIPSVIGDDKIVKIGFLGTLEDGSNYGKEYSSLGYYGYCYGLDAVKSITINEGILAIEETTFMGFPNLVKIALPSSITSIGSRAFYNTGILNNQTGDLKYADKWLITADTNITSAQIKDNTVGIANKAFLDCANLVFINIPDNVKIIGENAFSGCTSLKSINLGKSVSLLASNWNSGCSLENINVSTENTHYSSENGVLFNKDKTVLIEYPIANSRTEYVIPNGVTIVGNEAFRGCVNLISVTLPDGVTSIGNYTFYNCTNLTSINIPDSVTSIGDNAFSGTKLLDSQIGVKYVDTWIVDCDEDVTTAEIMDGTRVIDNYAFYKCTSLESINISESVISIGHHAFYKCTSLTSIVIPDGVTSIDGSAFLECTSLTSINIPNSVTSIKYSTFLKCTSLESINIPNSVTSIGYKAFNGCTNLANIIINNPNCTIYDNSSTIPSTTVIHGYANSTAQEYATKYSRTFVEI